MHVFAYVGTLNKMCGGHMSIDSNGYSGKEIRIGTAVKEDSFWSFI